MEIERSDLSKIFKGHWDGGGTEFHGLVRARGSQLQIECIRRDDTWQVSVFHEGVAKATCDDEDVRRAIATGLKQTLRDLPS